MSIRLLGPVGTALALAGLFSASPLKAQDESELILCAQIRDDAQRLECFDRAARQRSAEMETGAPEAQPAPAAAPVPAAGAPQPGPAPAPPPATAAPSAEADFGVDKPPEDRGEVRSIRSHIVGFFRGFEGGTEVRLANGQLWRQMDSADLAVHKTDPQVVIEKGFFGGYRLSVNGLNRSIRVKRIE
jgi:hypothetical protein